MKRNSCKIPKAKPIVDIILHLEFFRKQINLQCQRIICFQKNKFKAFYHFECAAVRRHYYFSVNRVESSVPTILGTLFISKSFPVSPRGVFELQFLLLDNVNSNYIWCLCDVTSTCDVAKTLSSCSILNFGTSFETSRWTPVVDATLSWHRKTLLWHLIQQTVGTFRVGGGEKDHLFWRYCKVPHRIGPDNIFSWSTKTVSANTWIVYKQRSRGNRNYYFASLMSNFMTKIHLLVVEQNIYKEKYRYSIILIWCA